MYTLPISPMAYDDLCLNVLTYVLIAVGAAITYPHGTEKKAEVAVYNPLSLRCILFKAFERCGYCPEEDDENADSDEAVAPRNAWQLTSLSKLHPGMKVYICQPGTRVYFEHANPYAFTEDAAVLSKHRYELPDTHVITLLDIMTGIWSIKVSDNFYNEELRNVEVVKDLARMRVTFRVFFR